MSVFNFIIEILFKYWNIVDGIIFFILTLILYLFPFTNDFTYRLILIACALFLIFVLKVIRQSYKYYLNFLSPIKVKRQVKGDGLYGGLLLIVLDNPGHLRDGIFLTLFSKSSGANQPICILRIIKAIKNEDLIAEQFAPAANTVSIQKYFNEDSRLSSLYAVPLINHEEFLKASNAS